MDGGEQVAAVLRAWEVKFLFTLCGGHISPILVGAKKCGIRIIDTRHEATAVFAADAVARLTGKPGVAAVTAGPGVTNTITAVQNARLAQSPVVLLGGATATALKNRGALQDIDQMALMRPLVKWAVSVRRVRDLVPAVDRAFCIARQGVPGPVFVECPVDLLYPKETVRAWYGLKAEQGGGLRQKMLQAYLQRHVRQLFAGADGASPPRVGPVPQFRPAAMKIRQAANKVLRASRPLLLIGSQSTLDVGQISHLIAAVENLGIPVYLSGMARGLLGAGHPLQMRHKRRQALKEADLVILAGVPCDFRLDYGHHIRRKTVLISANRSRHDLALNRRPDVAILGDPGRFLVELAAHMGPIAGRWQRWCDELRERDALREQEIEAQAREQSGRVNPLHICREIDRVLPDRSILVADGGDFVATASYTVRPRGPLRWLDPGVFGTLGVGAGFALGAKLCHPDAEVWILYGDGSCGYSLAEFDTFVRHRVPVIAVVGNDASWMQIAREQVEILQDDVGTVLARSDYHRVCEGFGAAGLVVEEGSCVASTLNQAQQIAASGKPVLVNVHLDKSTFRKGSISM